MNAMQLDCKDGKKDKLFNDVSLATLAEKFDVIYERVKDLKLFHLIEPIETVLMKIRELNELTEQYTCKHYGDYKCPDEDCRKELGFGKSVCKSACPKVPAAELRSPQAAEAAPPSSAGSSCGCCNSRGERSCHCGSSRGSLPAPRGDPPRRLEPSLHKTETYCIRETPRCSPCRCTVDASGKRRKTSDCRQAARARRESRAEAQQQQQQQQCEPARPRTADAKLTGGLAEPDVILLGGTVSQTMIKVEASWPDKTFKFTKEDTVVEPTDLATERAILCNMSSDSSSEDSTRTSCDNSCSLLGCQEKGEALCLGAYNGRRYSNKKNSFLDSDSYLDRDCGCGGADADEACPCGCGDLMELPEKTREPRSHCRCENCGKEIAEGDQTDAARCGDDERGCRREPRQKTAGNERCGKLQQDGRTSDIQKYIEELEEQCLKKDKIITQLQDQLIRLNDGYC